MIKGSKRHQHSSLRAVSQIKPLVCAGLYGISGAYCLDDSNKHNRPITYVATLDDFDFDAYAIRLLIVVNAFDFFHSRLQKVEVAKTIREDKEESTERKVLNVVKTEEAMAMKAEKPIVRELDFHITG